jgi:hypothetical protein
MATVLRKRPDQSPSPTPAGCRTPMPAIVRSLMCTFAVSELRRRPSIHHDDPLPAWRRHASLVLAHADCERITEH